MKQNFNIKAQLEVGEFSRDDILNTPNCIGCDSFGWISIVYDENNKESFQFMGIHGDKRPFSNYDWDKVMLMLASRFISSNPGEALPGAKSFCGELRRKLCLPAESISVEEQT